jgi:hypothetical protein
MTQYQLNIEYNLVQELFLAYTDKMLTFLEVGSDRYNQWYRDSLQLFFLLELENAVSITTDGIFIGSYEITENVLRSVYSKVREYWRTDLDSISISIDTDYGEYTGAPITPAYIPPYNADWKEVQVSITSNGPTTVLLPFDISITDPESIVVTVNGLTTPDHIFSRDTSKDGFHIIGNVLYWHSYYQLLTNDVVQLRYLQIK